MIESISKHIGNIVVVDNPTVFLQSTLEHSDKELVWVLCSVMPSRKVPMCLLKGTEPFYWNRKIKTFWGDVETAKQIKVIAFSFFQFLHIWHLSACKENATQKYKKNSSVPIESFKRKLAFKM